LKAASKIVKPTVSLSTAFALTPLMNVRVLLSMPGKNAGFT